ncbi:MAG: nitroreductase family protein [Chloroflexi bacterium]|nr:nitroreductase family protein [Chloroflexota bacterium]
MDLMQAITERRSIRKYKPDKISDADLNKILEAARHAPSWANSQSWRFVVVTDPSIKEKLSRTVLSRMPGKENGAAPAIRNAPVVIVACAELKKSGYYGDIPSTDKGDWCMFDVALAMQNLTLAAYALGLGTVHVGLFEAKKVAAIINVPEGYAAIELMPVGYPDEKPEPRPRKALEEIVYYEQFGKKK